MSGVKRMTMAIKLINALRNLNIEEKHEEIEKVINFLVSNCNIDSSQIEPSLLLSDYNYLQIEDTINHTSKVQEYERENMGIPWELPDANKMLEQILNQLIPNREPPQSTKYSAMAKILMSTKENNEQITIFNPELNSNHPQPFWNSSMRIGDAKVKSVSMEKFTNLRVRLMELFAEQKNWQKQLQEVGENMTLDDVRNQIKQAKAKITKHQDIIVKCEEYEKEQIRWIEDPMGNADPEYTRAEIEYWRDDPIDTVWSYSTEYSQKRIAFWEGEIAKHEQKLQMMEIVQQQLTQLMEEITNVNEQIKDATTNLTSEPMVECQSNKNSSESIPKHNMANMDWIFTNKATSEDKKNIKEYIKYLCESKASASEIKKYINEQEKDCILVHIKLKRQYEILSEIGVDFKEKTYLNA